MATTDSDATSSDARFGRTRPAALIDFGGWHGSSCQPYLPPPFWSAYRKHHDASGRACLEATGVAQPLTSNPKIFTHIVTLENRCADFIKVRVCYHGSDTCSGVEVPPRSRKEQMIGVLAMQQFRYDVKEQF